MHAVVLNIYIYTLHRYIYWKPWRGKNIARDNIYYIYKHTKISKIWALYMYIIYFELIKSSVSFDPSHERFLIPSFNQRTLAEEKKRKYDKVVASVLMRGQPKRGHWGILLAFSYSCKEWQPSKLVKGSLLVCSDSISWSLLHLLNSLWWFRPVHVLAAL